MKKLIILATLLLPITAYTQGGNTGMGEERTEFESIAKRLFKLEKKSNAFNLYINYAGSFTSQNGDESAFSGWQSAFRARDLRLEIKGELTDAIYYRFRQKLNRANAPGSLDNYSPATDFMMVGLKLGDHFAIEGGKICQHWGGFDYDENPLYIYQYSDFLDRIDIFFAGVAFYWRPSATQEFVFEATNPLTSTFEDTYGPEVYVTGSNLTELTRIYGARHLINLLVNWNGSFLDGKVLTRFAVGGMSQTDKLRSKIASGGIKFNFPKLQWYIDYMIEKDDMDRLGIATEDFGLSAGKRVGNVSYTSLIAKAFWQFSPDWNLVAKGSYDTVGAEAAGKYRKSLMGVCSLEYYPEALQDFRIFLAGTAHKLIFSDTSGLEPFGTLRLETGIIYRIKCY